MNIKRLKEMQLLMQAVHESVLVGTSKFSLLDWAKGEVSMNTSPNECGTTCCAVGFAMQHKPFNDQGLSIETAFDYAIGDTVSIPAYGKDSNWMAVQSFFDISHNQAQYCFGEQHYPENPTPLDVIFHIQHILDGKSDI